MKKIQKPDVINVRLVNEPYYISDEEVSITTPDHAIAYFGKDLASYSNEVVEVIFMNNKNRPIHMMMVNKGTINSSLVSQQSIFQAAILSNAACMIMMHNHPSGNVSPSMDDLKMFEKMKDAGNLIGVPILDSIVVAPGKNHYYSMKKGDRFCYCQPSDYIVNSKKKNDVISDKDLIRSVELFKGGYITRGELDKILTGRIGGLDQTRVAEDNRGHPEDENMAPSRHR